MTDPRAGLSVEQIAVARLAFQHMQARRTARYGRWDEAFRKLDAVDKATLEQNKVTHVDIQLLIRKVDKKKEECDQKKWTLFERSDGTKVEVRDVLEKIAQWMKRFEKIGDMVTSYDPVHASLPWAGVKFLLEASTSDFDAYATITDGLEVVSRVVVQVAEVEEYSPRSGVISLKSKTELSRNIVEIYVKVLKFLAIAQRFFSASTGRRIITSIFKGLQKAVKDLVDGISEVIGEIYQLSNQVNWQVSNAVNEERHRQIIDHLKGLGELVSLLTAQQRDRIRHWLDPIATDGAQKEMIDLRHGETCDWMLSNFKFQHWSQHNSVISKILWVHAPAGHGKSVLCARLIDHMQKDNDRRDCLLFFYCAGDDITRRHPIAILRSWIWQLVAKTDHAVGLVMKEKQALHRINDGSVASEADQDYLWELLAKLMAKDKQWTLVVDGYDECLDVSTTISKYNTLSCRDYFLQKLAETIRGVGIRVLLISRYQTEIETAFKKCSAEPSTLEITDYGITRDDTRNDLSSYSQTIFENKIGQSEDLSTMAADAVTKSEGMFLWLALLDKNLLEGATPGQAKDLVDETPAEIFKAYQAELDRILEPKNKTTTKRAVTILKWILYAARPLTVREMTEILAASFHKDPKTYPRDYLPRDFAKAAVDEKYVQNHIRMPCGSLIELRQASDGTPMNERTIHFVHFTVKEFLQKSLSLGKVPDSDLCFREEHIEHDQIACLCLNYMCYDVFNSASREGIANLEAFSKMYPFFSYTATNWADHYARGESSSTKSATDQILWQLFSTTAWKVWAEMYERHLHDTSRDRTGGLRSLAKSEYSDSGYGSLDHDDLPLDSEEESIMSDSQSEPLNDEVKQIEWRTSPSPVYYAAILGLGGIIHKLVELTPDNCTIEGGNYGNPLQAAVVSGQPDAVKALLEHDASPSQRGGVYGTPLIASVILGSSYIFGQLLGTGTDLDTRDDDGMTALYHACNLGQVNMVTELVKAGAKMNIKPAYGTSPLTRAVMQNHIDIVDFLLRHGAEVNRSEGRRSETPLFFAIYAQHEDMTELLLEHHADPSWRNQWKATALHIACIRRSVELVKLLLEKAKVDIEAMDINGLTPLHYAAESNAEDAAELLLDHGASPFRKSSADSITAVDIAFSRHSGPLLAILVTAETLSATDTATLAGTLMMASNGKHAKTFDLVLRTILKRSLSLEIMRDISILALELDHESLRNDFNEHIQAHRVSDTKSLGLEEGFWSEAEQKLIKDVEWGTDTQKSFVLDPMWHCYPAAMEILPDIMLPIAVSKCASSVVSMLLQRGADIHHEIQIRSATSQFHSSPLQIAVNQDSYELAVLMLKDGLTSTTSKRGFALLHSLERTCHRNGLQHRELAKMMIACGALDADSDPKTLAASSSVKTNRYAGMRDKDSDYGVDDDFPSADVQISRPDIAIENDINWWNKVLVGQWAGQYSYNDLQALPSDPTSFRINSVTKSSSMPKKDAIFFDGEGNDLVDSFTIHGQVRSASIRFVKLYPKHGWLYEGHVQEAKTGWKIQGSWGHRFGEASGDFTMSRDASA